MVVLQYSATTNIVATLRATQKSDCVKQNSVFKIVVRLRQIVRADTSFSTVESVGIIRSVRFHIFPS